MERITLFYISSYSSLAVIQWHLICSSDKRWDENEMAIGFFLSVFVSLIFINLCFFLKKICFFPSLPHLYFGLGCFITFCCAEHYHYTKYFHSVHFVVPFMLEININILYVRIFFMSICVIIQIKSEFVYILNVQIATEYFTTWEKKIRLHNKVHVGFK